MVYRIRYGQGGAESGEAVVEANSPTEALVKFRHLRNWSARPGRAGGSITSISAEQPPEFTEPAPDL